MTPKEMALTAAKALDEKKGGDIAAIEITEQTTLADYFVIATGNSNTQINALCGAVEKAMKEQAGEDPLRREGYRDGTWVLLDYGCVVVHVFSAEAREFYSLERLWHDGKPVDLSGVLTENCSPFAPSGVSKRFAAGKNMKWAGSACPFESNVVPRKTKILWGAVSGEKGKHQLRRR